MQRNTEIEFMRLRPGSIFRSLDEGFYFMATPERMVAGEHGNAIYIDGCISAVQLGHYAFFRPTERVLYIGQLGVNWFPDEF